MNRGSQSREPFTEKILYDTRPTHAAIEEARVTWIFLLTVSHHTHQSDDDDRGTKAKKEEEEEEEAYATAQFRNRENSAAQGLFVTPFSKNARGRTL